jgi:hypothetical protein
MVGLPNVQKILLHVLFNHLIIKERKWCCTDGMIWKERGMWSSYLCSWWFNIKERKFCDWNKHDIFVARAPYIHVCIRWSLLST